MARTTLAVQAATIAGIAVTFSAPNGAGTGNGNTFAHTNAAPAAILVKNADSGAHVVTIPANGKKYKGVTLPDFTKSVAAGATALIFVPPDLYADGSTNLCAIDVDGVTSVTWAAIKLPTSIFS